MPSPQKDVPEHQQILDILRIVPGSVVCGEVISTSPLQWKWIWANEDYFRMLGLAPMDFAGNMIPEIPENYQKPFDQLDGDRLSALAHGEVVAYTWKAAPAGPRFQATISPLAHQRFAAVFTPEAQTGSSGPEVQELSQQLDVVFNKSVMDLILFQKDPQDNQYRVLRVNEQNIRTLNDRGGNVTEQDFLGKTPEEVLRDLVLVSEERVKTARENIALAVEQKSPVMYYTEVDIRGELYHGEIQIIPLGIEEDDAKYILWSAHNITERVVAQTQIAEYQKGFEKVFLAASIGSWKYLFPERQVYWNPHALKVLGFTQDNAPRSWREFSAYLHEDDSRVMAEANPFSELPNLYQGVVRFINQGRVKWLRVVAQTTRDAQGTPIMSSGIVQDITEQKENEHMVRSLNQELERKVEARTRELLQSNQDLEAFAYTVSHDLRAPVRHILGFQRLTTSFLEKSPDKALHYLDLVRVAALRMEDLISDLLEYSRVTKLTLSLSQFSLAELVDEIIASHAPDLLGRNVTWNLDPLPVVVADKTMIRIVFDNLIGNALKFSSKQSETIVRIQAVELENGFEIVVRDNGAGFDPAYRNKLFQVFERLHSEEEFPGTGIGLATVLRIIRRHGGTIEADGVPGKGATFSLFLPKRPEQDW